MRETWLPELQCNGQQEEANIYFVPSRSRTAFAERCKRLWPRQPLQLVHSWAESAHASAVSRLGPCRYALIPGFNSSLSPRCWKNPLQAIVMTGPLAPSLLISQGNYRDRIVQLCLISIL